MKSQTPVFYGGTLKSLETLRFAAAVAVVLAHCGQFNVPGLQPFLGGKVFLGSLGVDVFFVISGFVMGLAALKSPPGIKAAAAFTFNRFLRLFPLYALATFGAAAVLVAKGRPVEPSHLLQSLFFLPTPGPIGVLDPILVVGWTLRFEMYFYLLLAAGIALNRKTAMPVAGILASLAAWCWSGFYFGAPLVLEFLLGFLLCIYREPLLDDIRARMGFRPFLIGMFLSFGLLLIASTGNDLGGKDRGLHSLALRMWIVYPWGELPRILSWGIPASLFVYFCLGLEKDFKWTFASLGKFTFSVYLLQYFALAIAGRLNKLPWMPDVMALAIGAVSLAGASVICYRFIEEPALRLRARVFTRKPVPPHRTTPPLG